MATTAATVITWIRRHVDDATDAAYGTNPLLDAINEASLIMATTTACCQAIQNVSSGVTAGCSWALSNLTYRYVNIYAVEYASAKLDWAPRSEAAHWSPTTATPTGWSVWADTLYLNENVTLSATNDLDVHYTYVPTTLTADTDNIGIPEKWIPALVAYGRYYIHDLNREEGLAQRAYAEFEMVRQSAAKVYEALLGGGGYS
ncbi:MAG: phage adaptor protein [Candidatus Hodarchaeales archaeon]|jgi:hypothetical protein